MKLITNRANTVLTGIMVAAAMTGCQSGSTGESVSDAVQSVNVMPPAEKPAADTAGTVIRTLRNGEPVTYSITAVDGDRYSVTASDGCNYTEIASAYAPSPEWKNCSGSTGTQTITKVKGSPWPMSVGTKFSYRFRGSDNRESWRGLRKCTVSGTEHLATRLGEFDTYRIVCKDPWSKRTWWYAPEIGLDIKYKRHHFTDSSRNREIETVEVVAGS